VFSIRKKITALTLGLVTITSLSIAAAIYYGNHNLLVEQHFNLISKKVSLRKQSLLHEFSSVKEGLAIISNDSNIIKILTASNNSTVSDEMENIESMKNTVQVMFKNILQAKHNFFQIRIIGKSNNGKEIIRVERQNNLIVIVDNNNLRQKGNRDYFNETIKLKKGQIYESKITPNIEDGKISEPTTYVSRISTPVYSKEGEVLGIMIINLNMNNIFKELRKEAPAGATIYITDNLGNALYSWDESTKSGTLYKTKLPIISNFPKLKDRLNIDNKILNLKKHYKYKNDGNYVQLFNLYYEQKLGHFIGLLIVHPDKLVLPAEKQMQNTTILITLTLILISFFLTRKVVGFTLKPIVQMTEAVEQFGKDRKIIDLPTKSKDEIGTMANTLERILKQVIENEIKTTTVIENAVDAIITINNKGIVSSYNKAAEQIFGYNTSEVIGNNIKMLMSHKDKVKHDNYLKKYEETGEKTIVGSTRELIGQKKDGTKFPLELSVSEALLNDEVIFIGMIRDIAKRKEVEDELKKHQNELEKLVEEKTEDLFIAKEKAEFAQLEAEEYANFPKKNPNPIIQIDQLGNLLRTNPSTLEEFPDIEKKGINHPILQNIKNNIDEILGQMEVRTFEVNLDKKYYHQTANPIFTGLPSIIIYSTDITNIKNIQRELEIAKHDAEKANSLKTEFLANMSHELRTPMHSIITFSRQGIEYISKWPEEEHIENLSLINESGERLLELINDLLDISKLEAGAATYDINEHNLYDTSLAVVRQLKSLIEKKNITINMKERTNLQKAAYDKDKLTQVILNLLSNSIKFTPQGSTITISFRKITNGIRFSITDEGMGIPEDELESVFDKFVQSRKTKTNAGGTGLGLAICKEIIEYHNGTIWAENNKDCGAKFSFIIPIKQPTEG